MAAAGAKVMIAAPDDDKLQAAVAEITDAGGTAEAVVCDVTSDEQVSESVRQTLRAFGDLSIVVANAGINGTWAPIADLSPKEWQATHAVNLQGTFLTMHHTVPVLRQRGGGSITAIASINGTRIFSNAGSAAYAASKAGQVALVKVAALELAADGIRVNAVCPGAFLTPIMGETTRRETAAISWPVDLPAGVVPLNGGDAGNPDDVASVVTFLASPAAKMVTGAELFVDGAESLLGETNVPVEEAESSLETRAAVA